MGNLNHYAGSGSGALQSGSNNPASPGETPEHGVAADGYASEDFVPGSSSSCRERKKGLGIISVTYWTLHAFLFDSWITVSFSSVIGLDFM